MVFYYVPEDGDVLSSPNAFIIRRGLNEVTLEMIEQQFPMDGDYFFRFKYSHSG